MWVLEEGVLVLQVLWAIAAHTGHFFYFGFNHLFLAVSILFLFWLSKDSCSKILLYASTIALVIGLPLTISRGQLLLVAVSGLICHCAGTNGKE
jgi:hypothetical protein